MPSPTLLSSLRTCEEEIADVLVERGKSPSNSKKSTNAGSTLRTGCLDKQRINLFHGNIQIFINIQIRLKMTWEFIKLD